MQIGFLGGTGTEGRGLALRFAAADVPVVIGSRSIERAVAVANEYNGIVGQVYIQGMTNSQMLAVCDVVFLTVPFAQAAPAIDSLAGDLRSGQILVDVTVPMRFVGGRADYWEQGTGSGAESLVSRVPAGVRLVGAFKTIPAHVLADLSQSLDCDIFVCGDSKDAVSRIMEISGMIATLRPLNAGPLASARILERMTVLAANLNRTYKKKGARFFIVGI